MGHVRQYVQTARECWPDGHMYSAFNAWFIMLIGVVAATAIDMPPRKLSFIAYLLLFYAVFVAVYPLLVALGVALWRSTRFGNRPETAEAS